MEFFTIFIRPIALLLLSNLFAALFFPLKIFIILTIRRGKYVGEAKGEFGEEFVTALFAGFRVFFTIFILLIALILLSIFFTFFLIILTNYRGPDIGHIGDVDIREIGEIRETVRETVSEIVKETVRETIRVTVRETVRETGEGIVGGRGKIDDVGREVDIRETGETGGRDTGVVQIRERVWHIGSYSFTC